MRGRRTAAVALALLATVGCTSTNERASSVPASSAPSPLKSAVEPTPTSDGGGTLRIVAGTPDSLDPARSYFPWMWNIMRLYTRTLVTYPAEPGPQGAELVPDLATGLGTPSDGGQTWTYTLKEDQRFEDGRAITSRDIKYGVERSFAADVIVGGPTYVVDLLDDPETPYAGPYLDPHPDRLGLATVETPDDLTVVFRLARPYADFDHVMALPSSSPVPREADTGADYGLAPVSSGPYQITSIDPVAGITLDRNPHWDPAADPVRTGLPDQIEVRTGLSGPERDQLLLGDAADVDATSSGLRIDALPRVEANSDLRERATEVTSGVMRVLALPATVPPMDDAHCRRAVALAVDPAALAQAWDGGESVDVAHTLWPQSLPGYQPAIDTLAEMDRSAALATAREELVACGQPDGFETVIATPNQPGPLGIATEVRELLADVGIEATVAGLDPATYYGSGVGRPENVAVAGFGVILASWSGDFPAPASFYAPLVSAVSPAGNANFAQVASPELTALVDSALGATDAEVADEAWRAVDDLLVDTAAYLPLLEDRVVLLAGQRLRNAYVHVAYGGYDLAVVGVR